jgi:hypothetical protein
MREIIKRQMELGEVDIGAIEISTKSRDDIPRLLRGLQYIYTTDEVRERVFEILAEVVPQHADGESAVSTETGRPGFARTSRDHRRWPNAFFAAHRLFTLHEAHALASQSR